MEACATAYNDIAGNNNINNGQPNNNQLQIPAQPNPNNQADGSIKFSFTPVAQGGQGGAMHEDQDLCGYYIQAAPPQGQGVEQQLAQAIQAAGTGAFNATFQQIQQFAQTSVVPFINGADGGQLAQAIPAERSVREYHAAVVCRLAKWAGGYSKLPGCRHAGRRACGHAGRLGIRRRLVQHDRAHSGAM